MMDPRYPIGKFQILTTVDDAQRRELIQQIADAPSRLRDAVRGLSDKQLDTPYREGGWTVRQVVHHLSDSHMNAYMRIKLALTENEPTIKPYKEQLWAELIDARTGPIESSTQILESLHVRWVILLRSLSPSDFSRTFRHPEHGVRNVDWILQLYAWHGRHHVAHITSLKEKMKW
jgi:uncharacterized damage-inducible protein DinB